MTTLNLILNMDNASFQEDRAGELQRIFRGVQAVLDVTDHDSGALFDANGNRTGYWTITHD